MKKFALAIAAGLVLVSAVVMLRDPMVMDCQVRLRAEGVAYMKDAGVSSRMNGRYAVIRVSPEEPLPKWAEPYGKPACTPIDNPKGWDGKMQVMPFGCACRRAKGTCEQQLQDGGFTAAPFGVTLAEGKWRGSGCAEKNCVEIQGESSWISDCPGG